MKHSVKAKQGYMHFCIHKKDYIPPIVKKSIKFNKWISFLSVTFTLMTIPDDFTFIIPNNASATNKVP